LFAKLFHMNSLFWIYGFFDDLSYSIVKYCSIAFAIHTRLAGGLAQELVAIS